MQDLRPLTPARRHNAEHLTFSTPSANLYEENDHSLWSSSFTSQQGPCEVWPHAPLIAISVINLASFLQINTQPNVV